MSNSRRGEERGEGEESAGLAVREGVEEDAAGVLLGLVPPLHNFTSAVRVVGGEGAVRADRECGDCSSARPSQGGHHRKCHRKLHRDGHHVEQEHVQNLRQRLRGAGHDDAQRPGLGGEQVGGVQAVHVREGAQRQRPIYIYIYIQRERERDTDNYLYIYIYMYREREKEIEREREIISDHVVCVLLYYHIMLYRIVWCYVELHYSII